MLRVSEELERKVIFGHDSQRMQHPRPHDPPGIGDVLQHRAQADEFRVPAIACELLREPGAVHVQPTHNTGDPLVLRGEFQKKVRLRHGLRRLHQHRAVDAMTREDGFEILRHVVAAQHFHTFAHPVIVATGGAPEMLMAIDSHNLTSYFFILSQSRFTPRPGASPTWKYPSSNFSGS